MLLKQLMKSDTVAVFSAAVRGTKIDLTGFNDKALDILESWAKVAAKGDRYLTNPHHIITPTEASIVQKAVVAEMDRRFNQ